MIDWYIEGIEFSNCNCAYGCPCQFEALPTQGHCRGFEVLRIDRGHFGPIILDKLAVALIYAWPGPIFEGNGELQVVLDARASPEQQAALLKVLMGEETDDGATHWWVYRAMFSRVHEPVVGAITFGSTSRPAPLGSTFLAFSNRSGARYGAPRVMFLDAALRRARITRDEVLASIRAQGVEGLVDLRAVVLETDGTLSVVRARVPRPSDSSLSSVAEPSQSAA